MSEDAQQSENDAVGGSSNNSEIIMPSPNKQKLNSMVLGDGRKVRVSIGLLCLKCSLDICTSYDLSLPLFDCLCSHVPTNMHYVYHLSSS